MTSTTKPKQLVIYKHGPLSWCIVLLTTTTVLLFLCVLLVPSLYMLYDWRACQLEDDSLAGRCYGMAASANQIRFETAFHEIYKPAIANGLLNHEQRIEMLEQLIVQFFDSQGEQKDRFFGIEPEKES